MDAKDLNFSRLIGRTALMFGKMLESKFAETNLDLNVHQYAFLELLSAHDQLIQQDFAEIMRKDKSAVLRTIGCLEQKKLIKRTSDPNDRRKKNLKLTSLGLKMLKQAMLLEDEIMVERLAGLSEEEIAAYAKVCLHIQRAA